MLRERRKAQESRRKMRRLLSEQLESRQLMASDVMQWASAPAYQVAMPSSAYASSALILSTFVGAQGRTMADVAGSRAPSMHAREAASFAGDFGKAIPVGTFSLSSVMPVTGKSASANSAQPVFSFVVGSQEGIEVAALGENDEFVFGKTSLGDVEAGEFDDTIAAGEFDLSDVMEVTVESTGENGDEPVLSVAIDAEERIEAMEPAEGDEFVVGETSLGEVEAAEFDDAIAAGEFDLSDVIAVTVESTGENGDEAVLSFVIDAEERIEATEPAEGDEFVFGETSLGEVEAAEFDDAIAAGEFDLSDVIAVTVESTGEIGDEAVLSFVIDAEERIKATEPAVGDEFVVGETSLGDAEAVEFGEAILVGEFDLSDVMEVTVESAGENGDEAVLSFVIDAEERIEATEPAEGDEFVFGETSLGEVEAAEFDDAIAAGEFDLSDVIAVTVESTGEIGDEAVLSFVIDAEERIEATEPAEGDEFVVGETSLGEVEAAEFDDAIAAGEFDLSDVMEVTVESAGENGAEAVLSFVIDAEERIKATEPAVGDEFVVGETSLGDAEAVEFGEAILVGEFELSDVMEVTVESAGENGDEVVLSVAIDAEERIEAAEPAEGDEFVVGETSLGDAEAVVFGEAIAVGEFDLSDVMPISAELINKQGAGSVISSNVTANNPAGVHEVNANDLKKAARFNNETAIVTQTSVAEENVSRVKKQAPAVAAPSSIQSIQRKRDSESMRNQLIDSALIELLNL